LLPKNWAFWTAAAASNGSSNRVCAKRLVVFDRAFQHRRRRYRISGDDVDQHQIVPVRPANVMDRSVPLPSAKTQTPSMIGMRTGSRRGRAHERAELPFASPDDALAKVELDVADGRRSYESAAMLPVSTGASRGVLSAKPTGRTKDRVATCWSNILRRRYDRGRNMPTS
jgi:hypothetical protein